MESARLAHRHDLHRVAELWGDATAELGTQRGGELLIRSVAPPGLSLDGMRQALERPDLALAVGAVDDVVIGFGYGRVVHPGSPTEPDRAPIGVIEVLYVEPEARGIGVGEAMAEVLLAHFDAQGCTGVDAFALPGNRAAKSFFETHGFVTRMLVMHRPTRGIG